MPPAVRDTRQKRAIRDVFERATQPLSAEDILEQAQAASAGLGMATVYRSLRALLDDGLLQTVELPGRVVMYERADKAHHHHFLCSDCERVFEIDNCSTEVKGSLPRGFRATSHDVTIYGTCAECGRKRRARSPARTNGR